MTHYIVEHEKFGYLAGKSRVKPWVDTIAMARVYNGEAAAKNSANRALTPKYGRYEDRSNTFTVHEVFVEKVLDSDDDVD